MPYNGRKVLSLIDLGIEMETSMWGGESEFNFMWTEFEVLLI